MIDSRIFCRGIEDKFTIIHSNDSTLFCSIFQEFHHTTPKKTALALVTEEGFELEFCCVKRRNLFHRITEILSDHLDLSLASIYR